MTLLQMVLWEIAWLLTIFAFIVAYIACWTTEGRHEYRRGADIDPPTVPLTTHRARHSR